MKKRVKLNLYEYLKNNKFILASASSRRHDILKDAGFDFVIKKPDIIEQRFDTEGLTDYVMRLAYEKSFATTEDDKPVLAADTIVTVDDQLFEKPGSAEDAKNMLMMLSARSHLVYTAICIRYQQNVLLHFLEQAEVFFSSIDDTSIENYIASQAVFDKAGSYGIQDSFGSRHIYRIEGEYNTIVGLPLASLIMKAKKVWFNL